MTVVLFDPRCSERFFLGRFLRGMCLRTPDPLQLATRDNLSFFHSRYHFLAKRLTASLWLAYRLAYLLPYGVLPLSDGRRCRRRPSQSEVVV